MSDKIETWKCVYCGCADYQDGEIATDFIGIMQSNEIFFHWGKRNSKKLFARACEKCGNVSLHVDVQK